MKIFKYTLDVTDRQTVMLPRGAKLLTVQIQHNRPQLWAIVDETANADSPREILIFGTGHPMPETVGQYLGSVQLHGGSLVFHVFEAA